MTWRQPFKALSRRLDLSANGPWLGAYLLICLIAGTVAGAIWYGLVDLPAYELGADLYARLSERGRAQVFAADVWLAGLGLVAGPLLGWLAWRWFGRLGWLSAVIAALAGLIAAAVTSAVGHVLGPGDFATRLSNAQPGDQVVIEFASHTPVYLAVWVALATLPVLLGSFWASDASRGRWIQQDSTI
ncbi:MAG: hypothetical protein LBJ44_01060 [Propionibacteriaceae bacterium]|jgi:hypothetical protein|nr:hypothetical protein [Propionibacteriaceae bacterium]